ncbi:hypothetical protein VTL71DRAFT_8718 [Oculimacula yallundae]|uniref:Cyclopropane-fatty-acyl-phospholipid synthase n=1 Tax=Oculimacula yallundae TaxID=86028 RepID=A0ABR4CYL8_9HELO
MAAKVIDGLKELYSCWLWPPTVNLARNIVLQTFSRIKVGSLLIRDGSTGLEQTYGQKSPKNGANDKGVLSIPHAEIIVKRDSFWLRLLLFADMGFAEGYMLDDFECHDLTSFFRLFIMNRQNLNDGLNILSSFSTLLGRLGRSTNSLSNSLLNTVAHYDISNDMFEAILSKDMTYSCPIWQCGDDMTESLEDAQQTKLLCFIEGAKIKASDHVLEIGTGWGSFAIEAVKRTGCRVTTITLSRNQKELAEERIKLAGLTHRIEVDLMDYRQIPIPAQPYDKIISIEMIEAVGQDNLAEYFACVNKLLKKDGGIAMFQCITIPEAQHAADVNKRERFISKYIFPGGYLPSTMELLNHIDTQSEGRLTLERIENIGGHYAKALRLWREKFLLDFDHEVMPALLQSYPSMSNEAVKVFRRKWEYYFSYCEAGFLTKTLSDVIITVGRAGTLELMEGIPL